MKENKLHFQQEQIEQLQELGAYLHQFRTEQCISLEEVAARTRIQARLLNAIEQGQLEELPEPVYIQGFIKRFADVLGLNGTEFASAFPTTGPGLQLIRPTWRHLPSAQLRPIHLYGLYVLLVIGSVSGLSYLVNRSAIQVAPVSTPQPPAGPAPIAANSAPTAPQQQGATVNLNAANVNGAGGKPVQVGVILKSQSWLRVVADGKTEFEGVLPEGTQRTWAGNQQVIVRAGNAGGVLVEFNDEQAKQMGAPGEVQEVTFAAQRES
ncbi:MAG: DUF4115 domain-containing protein [Kastovskya adunca ATA6-11-RM4]|jgi:cytoskeletal protein RodZ|nr:DUF4115 domain-containing protein [Kastovskya adunca ATA6-11-RM4]